MRIFTRFVSPVVLLTLTACAPVSPQVAETKISAPQKTFTSSASNIQRCAANSLPPQARTTIDLIYRDGPFPYPRNDGKIFGNFERHLPQMNRGYYHEYTVLTPGSRSRGARRIVTGGKPLDAPPYIYYTADHYSTFCKVTGA